jgi:hypothetical protein
MLEYFLRSNLGENKMAESNIDSPAALLTLGRVEQKIEQMAEALAAQSSSKPARPSFVLELSKIIFGGWPALGLIFVVLFYAPLRDALNAIPDKVKGAQEIGVLGVSLKSTIIAEAQRQGLTSLSTVIPTLSPEAIELLLRGSKGYNSLTAYTKQENGGIDKVWLPAPKTLKALEELEAKELVSTQSRVRGSNQAGVESLRRAIALFKQDNPGEEGSYAAQDQIQWNLKTRKADGSDNRLDLSWGITDLGKQAVTLILRAVAVELSPKEKGSASPAK